VDDCYLKCVIRPIIQRNGGVFEVVPCFILESGHVAIKGHLYSMDEFSADMASGKYVSELPIHVKDLRISDLCSLRISKAFFGAEDLGFVIEVRDAVAQLQGQPGMIVDCQVALEHAKSNPTAENIAALRSAYDSIPDYLKCWIGSLDAKDSEVRTLLGLGDRRV